MSQTQHEIAGVGCVSWRTSDSSQNESPSSGAQAAAAAAAAAAGAAHWLPAKVGLSGGVSSLQLSAEVLSAVVGSGTSQVAGGVQQQSSGGERGMVCEMRLAYITACISFGTAAMS